MEAITSVENQNFKDYEIIIIDDGSDDLITLQLLKELEKKDKLTILQQQNSGPGIARNNGIAASKWEFLVMLDSDNKIRKNTIKIALSIFDKKNEVGVIYGDYEYFGLKTGIHKQEDFNLRKQFNANHIEMASIMRKQTFIDSGGFDCFTSKYGIEDYDLWFSIAETKWKFYYINEVLFDIRIRTDSRTLVTANPNLDKLLEHIYKKHSNLLYKEFEKLYHDYKNITNTLDYRLGNVILKPLRKIKRYFQNRTFTF
ncbi:MAG: glycosyltransferase family 2 protein [Bacteroidia bacterium]|nr:glycosyltransferase family 2 protein [Bacteroidia bacterium]